MNDSSSDETERIVLVQCTNSKRDVAAPAHDLYDESHYFRTQRAYAKAKADAWFIQSAKHGLVHPDTELEPYNMRASDLDEPEVWATAIATDLSNEVETPATVEILGGRSYADPLTPELESYGFDVFEPLRGQAIGKRMQSLTTKINQSLGEFA